jgi:release factor glutamine methyltransferase
VTPTSIESLLQQAQEHLRAHSVETPRLDAEVLLAHVLKVTREALAVRSSETPGEPERSLFHSLIDLRERGTPVAYLTGHREFCGLDFAVTPDVLIPRPETEILVERALQATGRPALDVGTGSGCIAIALSRRFDVTATDRSEAALAVARHNASRHRAPVRFIRTDLFDGIGGRFDLIVSNPPYVSDAEIGRLPREVLREPRFAVSGGADGLSVLRRLIRQAPEHLGPDGRLLVEIGAGQTAAVREIFDRAGFRGVSSHRDLAGIDRVVEGICSS